MSNEQLRSAVDAFTNYESVKEEFKGFLEKKPLYVKLKIKLPDVLSRIQPDALILQCSICQAERPFRDPRSYGSGAGMGAPPTRQSGLYTFYYQCTGCRQDSFTCWVEVNYGDKENSDWVRKVGQLPMWLPPIAKDIKQELGENAELYQKALRNMNEGYGIGACAYLRRLIEKYINPLLQLLHDIKQSEGASIEELSQIQETIKAKDFSSKTKYASEIAPASILVEGHNPLKEIHERLSVGLHTLDEEKANEYAVIIRDALEFVVRGLHRQHEERKAYAAKLKQIRSLEV